MFNEHGVKCFKIFPSKYIWHDLSSHVTSPVRWPYDTPGAISYRCPIVTESVAAAIFEIMSPKDIEVTNLTLQGHVTSSITWPIDSPYAHRQTDTRYKWFYILSHAVYCISQTKIRTKINAYINIKNIDWLQMTRLRFMNEDISRSLLQSKNSTLSVLFFELLHCCRPSSAYMDLCHRLYSFYCANELLRQNLLLKHNSTPCCCGLGLRCLLSKMATSSFAANIDVNVKTLYGWHDLDTTSKQMSRSFILVPIDF